MDLSVDGVDGRDAMVSLVDVSFELADHLRILRVALEQAGIAVEVRTWLGGTVRPGSTVMASLVVRTSELASA